MIAAAYLSPDLMPRVALCPASRNGPFLFVVHICLSFASTLGVRVLSAKKSTFLPPPFNFCCVTLVAEQAGSRVTAVEETALNPLAYDIYTSSNEPTPLNFLSNLFPHPALRPRDRSSS